MELDFTFFAFAIPAVLFAGISKGGFGSGAAFAAAPFLALAMPPQLAVGVMLPMLMLMDITSLKPYWRKWSWPDAKGMMIGGLPGVFLGVALYRYTSEDALRLVIGLVAVGFVAFQVAREQGWIMVPARPFTMRSAVMWGSAAGFTSFVSHAGGPPAAIHLLGQRLPKEQYQATTVIVFWWINLLKFVPYIFLGFFTPQTAIANLWLAPVAVTGALIGVKAHKLIPEKLFFKVTYILLTVTGSKLIWDALT